MFKNMIQEKTHSEKQHGVNSRFELLKTRQQLVFKSSNLEFTRCCFSECVFFLYFIKLSAGNGLKNMTFTSVPVLVDKEAF